MTTQLVSAAPNRHGRAIAASVSRIMRLRDGMRGETNATHPFVHIDCGDGRVAALVSASAARVALGADRAPPRRGAVPTVACLGDRLPFPDGAAAYVVLSDVLGCATDPVRLVRAALRVARHGVILCDRLVKRRGDRLLLRALDLADGRRTPRYWTERQWWEMAERAGAHVTHWDRVRDVYPAPASWMVGGHLHVVMVLEPEPPNA